MTLLFALLLTFQPYTLPPKQEIKAFVYHRFGDSRYPSTNISVASFESHLKYLKQQKIPVLTLFEAMGKLPSQVAVVITIDDGYHSFYQRAFPLLQKYGFKASVFINTESVGGKDYMSWEEIQEISQYGIEIGNHSSNHEQFLNIAPAKQLTVFKQSVTSASRVIEEKTGIKPTGFAYPYGEYSIEMVDVLKELGIKYALAQNSGVIDSNSNPYILPRFPMTGMQSSQSQFIQKVNMHSLQVTPVQQSQMFDNNPPILDITITDTRIDHSTLQCFIQGKPSQIIKNTERNVYRVQSKSLLLNRRTLYTITAKSKTDNTWYWYSKLWVNPLIPE